MKISFAAIILITCILLGCSSGGSSTEQINNGVNQLASNAWSFRNITTSTNGIIRLVNDKTGIISISSNNPTQSLELQGQVTNFIPGSSLCLPQTPLAGSVNKETMDSASISLTNCVFSESQLTALVTIKSAQQTIYSDTEIFNNIEIASTSMVAELANTLAESNPALYNHNVNIYAKFIINLNNLNNLSGNYPANGGISGQLFGQFVQQLTSGTSVPFVLNDGKQAEITFSMIDSTSVNIMISMVNSGQVTQLKCNALLSGLVVNNTLNPYFNGFITECTGTIPTEWGIISDPNVTGNITLK